MENFTAVRGETFTLNLAFTDSEAVAVDLTDWEWIKMTLKRLKTQPDPTEEDEDYQGIQVTADVTDAEEGLAEAVIEPTDSENLLGTYFYDVRYLDGDGVVKTAMEGVITFKQGVTRAITA